jgi:hypothetical protein
VADEDLAARGRSLGGLLCCWGGRLLRRGLFLLLATYDRQDHRRDGDGASEVHATS